MAVEFVEITDLTEYLASDLDGNEPLQISGTAFTTINEMVEFGQKKYPSPNILEIPNSLFNLTSSSSSSTIKKEVLKVGSSWADFVGKINAADLIYSRINAAAANTYWSQINMVTSNLKNVVTFKYYKNDLFYTLQIEYVSSSDTYSCTLQTVSIPKGTWVYKNGESVLNDVQAGTHAILINPSGDIVVNLDADSFTKSNNTVCKVVVPGPTTKVTVNTGNGIPALYSDMAWEPSDLGGGTQDRILFRIEAISTSANPTSAHIWFFVDAEVYRLR